MSTYINQLKFNTKRTSLKEFVDKTQVLSYFRPCIDDSMYDEELNEPIKGWQVCIKYVEGQGPYHKNDVYVLSPTNETYCAFINVTSINTILDFISSENVNIDEFLLSNGFKPVLFDELEEDAMTTSNLPGYDTPKAFGGLPSDSTIEQFGYKRVNKVKSKSSVNESSFVRISKMLNELNYQDYKSNEETTTKFKINNAIKEMNRKLFEIERTINQNVRLKVEMGVNGDKDYWKSSRERIYKMYERMLRVVNKLKELESNK